MKLVNIFFFQVLNLKNQKQKAISNGNRKQYLSTQLTQELITENRNISKLETIFFLYTTIQSVICRLSTLFRT